MKKILLFLCAIFLLNGLSSVFATCTSGQIDINTASAEDLDRLSGIGPVKAQAIIDTRPFSSLDNLVDVDGIAEVTLEKIKTQGLACVSGEENNQNTQEEEDTQEEETPQEDEEDIQQEETQNEEEESVKEKETTKRDISVDKEDVKEIKSNVNTNMKITGNEIETIVLTPNPKGIKSESNMEQLNKNKFAIYGIIIFCILLVILFGFKKTKNEKNEFK